MFVEYEVVEIVECSSSGHRWVKRSDSTLWDRCPECGYDLSHSVLRDVLLASE